MWLCLLQLLFFNCETIAKEKVMNRIYAALAAVTLLASPAFAKSHHIAKAAPAVSDKAETKPAEAKPAEGEAKPAETAKPKKTKKTTKKTTEEKKEAAPEA